MILNLNTLALINLILVTTAIPINNKIKNDLSAMLYLQKFGYMEESVGTASLVSIQVLQNAIQSFQRFAGLNQTGILDEETLKLMNTPRCGNRDDVGETAHRRKRYALQGSKWKRNDLTYTISKHSRKLKRSITEEELARAFKVWSDVTPLNFIPKKEGRVHIDIRFAVGEHGDGDPFDGPGNTLAHAFFPQFGGDVHFDDEEYWTTNSYFGTNFFQVAAHELGHALGLSHSSSRDSLMAPFYRKYQPVFNLNKDDILGIQALYGKRKDEKRFSTSSPRQNTPNFKPEKSDSPNLCQNGSIDAITRVSNGNTYVFKGEHYWRVTTNGLAEGYPRKISQDWGTLPGNIDAALTWADGKTFFFKGDQYWRFRNMHQDSDYPKNISVGFLGIPPNIDAAFVWSGNGKTYFTKGDLYWKFDSKLTPPVDPKYPKPLKNWMGLPKRIDAAFKWENGLTYFFRENEYYRFNDGYFEVDKKANPQFPRNTSTWWFDCKSASSLPLLGSLSKDIYDKKNDDVLEEKFESDGFFLVKNSEKEWINYFKNGGEQPHSMLNKATFSPIGV